MGTVQLTAVPLQPVCVAYVPSLFRINTLYPVITEPPFAGAIQFITTLLPEIEVVGAAGVEGAAAIIAPLPGGDAVEGPTVFRAII